MNVCKMITLDIQRKSKHFIVQLNRFVIKQKLIMVREKHLPKIQTLGGLDAEDNIFHLNIFLLKWMQWFLKRGEGEISA